MSKQTIAAVPGLERLTLLQDYLDGALAPAAERPGWAGTEAVRSRDPGVPSPTHWRSGDRRRDAIAA